MMLMLMNQRNYHWMSFHGLFDLNELKEVDCEHLSLVECEGLRDSLDGYAQGDPDDQEYEGCEDGQGGKRKVKYLWCLIG